MTDIDRIDDVEALKQIARQLEQEIQQLLAKVAELTEKLAKLEGKDPNEELQRELKELKRQLATKQRKLFGRSSERRRKKPHEKKKRKKRTKFGYRAQPKLTEKTTEHTLHPDERDCPDCGGELEPTNRVAESGSEITIVEREYKISRHVRRVYRCDCGRDPVTAPGPVKLIPRGRYSLDFAISVAIDKYLHHMPLARQVAEMKSRGLIMDTQTLWDQLAALAKHLEPSYELIRHYILGADVIGADETWWRVMQESSSQKWWVWAMSTHNAVFYRVDETRSGEAARQCLGDYKGILVCDGYAVYKSLARDNPALYLAYCWSHARRKFFEAHKDHPDECDEALDLIEKLFVIERQAPNPEALEGDAKAEALARRAELRESKSRPITTALLEWAEQQQGLPEGGLRKAIGYMKNHWEGLLRFLDDPSIPIHNNHMEQELRNWVLGRKNHYGSRSKRGTEAAAVFYTVLETAKLCGVDPADYLRRVATSAIYSPGSATLPHELISAAV